jgi:hypothetical protein
MALIYQFPRHRLVGRDVNCNCWASECVICSGGLAFCDVCHGAEGSLPTCCPGERMPACVEMAVMFGHCDYDARDGWIQRSNAEPKRRFARQT